ncbi:hypothetical protein MYX82_07355 [Acidobacteria bacterium AH-259-D05]|nr:hypothetical protein [Acidobacteria bacterium AH-259-D05]
MMKFLPTSVFYIRLVQNSKDMRPTWYPILAVGLAMIGFICIKSGRDAVFFNQGGLRQLPLAYIWIAVVSLPAGMLHLTAIKTWGARRTRVRVFLLTGFIFLSFVPFVDLQNQIAIMAMFILTPVIFAAVFAAAWLLAGDLLEGAGSVLTRWTYSRIGASSMLGGMVGGLLASLLSPTFSPRVLVAVGALTILGVAWLVSSAHRSYPASGRAETLPNLKTDDKQGQIRVPQSSRETIQMIKQPYTLGLIGVGALAALAAIFIDFQFYAVVTFSGYTTAEFFGGFYALLNMASLFLQLLVAPWLQSRFGLGRTLMVLPLAVLAGVGLAAYSATVIGRSAVKLTESGVKASIHRSVWEQVFLPIRRGQREIIKMLVDGVSARMSEGIGAAGLYVWLWWLSDIESLNPLSIFWAVVTVVLSWIALTVYLNNRGCFQFHGFDPVLRLPDS